MSPRAPARYANDEVFLDAFADAFHATPSGAEADDAQPNGLGGADVLLDLDEGPGSDRLRVLPLDGDWRRGALLHVLDGGGEVQRSLRTFNVEPTAEFLAAIADALVSGGEL